MSVFPYSSSLFFPFIWSLLVASIVSCLTGKSRSPSDLPPAVITACQKGTMHNRAQGSCGIGSIRQEEAMIQWGQSKEVVALLVYGEREQFHLKVLKRLYLLWAVCVHIHTCSMWGWGRLVHSVNKHLLRPPSMLNTQPGTTNIYRRCTVHCQIGQADMQMDNHNTTEYPKLVWTKCWTSRDRKQQPKGSDVWAGFQRRNRSQGREE